MLAIPSALHAQLTLLLFNRNPKTSKNSQASYKKTLDTDAATVALNRTDGDSVDLKKNGTQHSWTVAGFSKDLYCDGF